MLIRNQCLKILLVEDDLAAPTTIEDLLGSFSESLFLLQTVKSLERGVACLEVEKFDAVLLDLSVSDCLGGSEDLAVLKARWPTVSIVVLTDINDENTALSVLGWGAQDCLVKGRFHRELLVRAIHYAIERQRIEAQLRQQALRERLLGKMIEHIRSSIDAASILQSTVAGDGLPLGYIENQNISADGGGVMLCFGRIPVGTSNSRCQRCRLDWQLQRIAGRL